MEDIRTWIEGRFEALARIICGRPLVALALVLLLAALAVSQLPHLRLDTSTEGFLHEDDPTLIAYNDFRREFGRDEVIIMALRPDDVFSLRFLGRLKALHEDLESNVPYLDEVFSLINARSTRGEGDSLIVEDLLGQMPETGGELAALKRRVMRNPLYINTLVSADGSFTTVLIKTRSYSAAGEAAFDPLAGFTEQAASTEADEGAPEFLTDQENSEVVRAVREVLARHEAPDFPIEVAGSPWVTDTLKRGMMRDMRRFVLLVSAAIGVFLFVMFRRISGVLLPLLIVVLTLLSTLGIMSATGTALKLPTQILPSFLLAVCVGDSVHLLAIFYRRLAETGDKHEAIVYAMGHSGLALVFTSLTTAGGLLSFATAEIAPVADLGVFAAAGVMVALIYTLLLVPSILVLLPVKQLGRAAARRESSLLLDNFFKRVARVTTRRPWVIIALSALVLLVSLVGVSRVGFSHYVLGWFPEGSEVRRGTELIDRELRGSISLEVLADTGREGGVYDPAFLKGLDSLARQVEGYDDGSIFVGKAWSVADILKEVNRALNEDREEYYRVPDDRDLVAQEFLLFENSGSDDLKDVVDSRFSTARFTVKSPFVDALAYDALMQDVEARFAKTLGPDVKITVTGMLPLLSRTLASVMHSMARSYLVAAVVITLMMVFLIGDLRMGLLSMLPNFLPIVFTIGVMGWLGMPMDMFTMLVGSIAIGLVVDDTVHFMHNFRRYRARTGSTEEAVFLTLSGSGRAMLVTTCVLSLGFFVFMFSEMNNLFNFGLLTGTAIIAALAADFFLAPALLAVALPRHKEEDR